MKFPEKSDFQMEEDVLKKTCIFEAPKRPAKCGNVQQMVSETNAFLTKNENSRQIEEITLDDDDDDNVQVKIKCKYCAKDITSWNKLKRETHQLECKKPPKTKKAKFTEVLDKKKEKEAFVEESTMEKVEKKWEISKDSVKFAKIEADEEANRRRKRPRSFAVVELAPRECHCEVLSTLHTRFLEKFAVSSRSVVENGKSVTEFAVCQDKLLKKVSRLEQLSIDFRKMADDETNSGGMMTLRGFDGIVQCSRQILKYRTTILTKHPSSSLEICLEFPRQIIKLWLIFVQSAHVEWSQKEGEMVRKLGESYGPVGMVAWIDEQNWEWRGRVEQEEPKTKESEPVPEPELVELELEQEPDREEHHVEIQEPDIFDTDDPLIGFDTSEIREEPMEVVVEQEIIEEPIFRKPGGTDFEQKSPPIVSQNQSIMEDSFDNFRPSNILAPRPEPELEVEAESDPGPSTSDIQFFPKTPENRQSFEKLSFASNIRVIKTTNITPMPDFELMGEEELKNRMKEIGQRPKGRKKMIEMLRMAYDTIHPCINPDTPTIRPIVVGATAPPKPPIKSLHQRLVQAPKEPIEEEDEGEADKTLNMSDEFEMVGKLVGEGVEEEEEEEEFDRKDMGSMKSAFLQWIRAPMNFELYNHMLSLNPVSLDELLARLAKSSGPESLIGKAKLTKILDELSITYQLPQKPGTHRKGAFGGGRRTK